VVSRVSGIIIKSSVGSGGARLARGRLAGGGRLA